jgi:phage gp36-like protein
MPYATVDDMVRRFGSTEMIRLTTPSDQEMDGIVQTVALTALETASARIDSYVRRRYRTPLDVPPPEIVAVCCDLARYELGTGDGKTTSEEVRLRAKDATAWLQDISVGKVVLDLEEVAIGNESYSQVQVRDGGDCLPPFGRGAF